MKTLKLFIAALLVGSCASLALAANETDVVGNLGDGVQMGAVHTSSGTSRRWESRRIDTNDSGNIKISYEDVDVVLSTGIGFGGLYVFGSSTNTFAVNSSSWVGVTGCRNPGDNCNVIALASQSSKVFVKKIVVSSVLGDSNADIGKTVGAATMRLFDSQGSTALASERFRMAVASNTSVPVEVWFSSGVTFKKDINSIVNIYLGKQVR